MFLINLKLFIEVAGKIKEQSDEIEQEADKNRGNFQRLRNAVQGIHKLCKSYINRGVGRRSFKNASSSTIIRLGNMGHGLC